jgi:DNA repair protein RecN (Recombination protein N)
VLASLAIRNFVLIEDAVLEFRPGLNVLTGETGAGKTLLTRALGLLIGERAEEGLVGQAAPEALIQAVFELTAAEVADIPQQARELVGDIGPGEMIVTRRLGREGRNRCYINDTGVTLNVLGSVAAVLLSFAGQHEYRRLLDSGYQLSVLDQWAGPAAGDTAARFRERFGEARDAARRVDEARRNQESRARELDLVGFEVAELDQARLSLEEEAALLAEQRVLSRAEEILRNTALAAELLRSDGDGVDAGSMVAQAHVHLQGLAGVDATLDVLAGGLAEIEYQLVDVARELHAYAARVSVDPARGEQVDARLRLYTDLARKYGGTTENAIAHLASARARLEELRHGEESLAQSEAARIAAASRAMELSTSLTALRAAAAPLLERAVAAQLGDLGMPSAAFSVELSTAPGWEGLKESGAEAVEFLLRANPGQEARSLARTASGGELSRVLLAVKCALAGAGGDETLVFDEIDAGIGGRMAVAVGNKLRELAERSQVIVVTHLPQVAALARTHHVIDKVSDGATTVTRLSPLDEDAVVEELCRMLGGRPGDAEVMAHARDLRDRAAGGLLD